MDVIGVARDREPAVRLIDIAKDFRISGSCLNNWLRDADVEGGIKPGMASDDRAENRELDKRLRLLEQENEVLRRAAAYLSQANLPKNMVPLVRELAVDGISVTVTCRVLKLCCPQYYRWVEQPFTNAELDEAWLANAIFDAHTDDPEFGYRFLVDEIRLIDEYADVSAGWCGGSAVTWAGGPCSGSPGPARDPSPGRRLMTT